ncbi:MAG TPA: hypothetical protein VIX19_18045 [Terriglobales bacterium]
MTMIRMLICSNFRRLAWPACALLFFSWAGTATACADDDFGQIVHEIEARYHVHRNLRFLMGLAGLTVRVTHVAGARDLKAALFENQPFDATGAELDDLVISAGARGWQPLVRSFDRRSGEHTFIYARNAGKNLRILLVTVEPNEGLVLEATVNQSKLLDFIDRHQHHTLIAPKGGRKSEQAGTDLERGEEIEMAAAEPPSNRGTRAFVSARLDHLP